MPELNPLTNEQIFLKKIAENTGSDYHTGDVSEINPITIDQILLKEIAANTAGQSGDITELEEKVSDTQDMLSDAYDSTHTYNVGDYCIHEDVLYKCNTASTTGTWDSSKWDSVTVTHEVKELTKKQIKTVTESFTTSSNSWILFPSNRTVLSAYIVNEPGMDYVTLLIAWDGGSYISKLGIENNVPSTSAYNVIQANHTYSVKYSYIET